MRTINKPVPLRPLSLKARTAEDLMSPDLISLPRDASVQQAITLMTDRHFQSAPVIDDNGRPLGVITVTDILLHDREYVRYLKTGDMTPRLDVRNYGERLPADMGIEVVERTCVEDVMTPAIFVVNQLAPASDVVHKLLDLNVHHIFVSDQDGTLIGVISARDILRQLS